MTTPAFALSANHDGAEIRRANRDAAREAADAFRRLATLIFDAAYGDDLSDTAFLGLAGIGDTAEALANELDRKADTYRHLTA